MESGGDILPGGAIVLDSIHILRTGIDGRQQLRCIEPPCVSTYGMAVVMCVDMEMRRVLTVMIV